MRRPWLRRLPIFSRAITGFSLLTFRAQGTRTPLPYPLALARGYPVAEFNILDHLERLKSDGGSNTPNGDHSFKCPACGANNFKVNLSTGKWGGFSCDCSSTEQGKRRIREALSPALKPSDLAPSAKPNRPKNSRSWTYTDRDGKPILELHRTDDGIGNRKIWQNSLVPGKRPGELVSAAVPYGLRDALQALDDGAPCIFWVEGEPLVDALRAVGLYGVTSIGGAGKFKPERDGGHIPPDRLVVVPDRDQVGVAHADEVAEAHPGCKWLYPFPGTPQWNGNCPPSGGLDIADWIAQGASVAEILDGIAPRLRPKAEPSSEATGARDLDSYSELLDLTLTAIRCRCEDDEMLARAELKNRFRVSDEQISTALFKRLSQSKVEAVTPIHDSVSMADVEMLHYQLDGWIQQGDIGLTYGSYGTGKTTLAIWKAYNAAKGQNILDRSTPSAPIKSLIIATDSGLGPLYKSFDDLGIDPGLDPLFVPGHPNQMIYIWGHDPSQGHGAWICDIHGVIRLEQFIVKYGIGYVAIDSAKSVSSAAGWSYTSNESVKALLKYLKEVIAKPTGCFIEFLSHDGTEKGSHSGAKAWAEDPSMVCHLIAQKDPDNGRESVTAQFRKDRAAAIDPRRQVNYFLEDQQLKLAPLAEVVGSCEDAITSILWNAYLKGIDSLQTSSISDEAFARFKKSRKTVENTLARITGTGKGTNAKPLIRKGRGRYALAPHEIQRLAALELATPHPHN